MIGNGQLRFFGFIRNIDQHILHAAGENAAKVIERRGGNIAVVLEESNVPRRNESFLIRA